MTYAADDASIETSRPRELYTLVIDTTTYRYTSHHADVSYGGNTFTAVAGLERGEASIVSTGSVGRYEMVVTLPRTDDAIGRLTKVAMPPLVATCLIQRLQVVSGVAIQIWSGEIVAANRSGMLAKLRIASSFDALGETSATRVKVQRRCNWAVYDADCGAARASFDRAATVTDVVTNRRFSVDALPAGLFNGNYTFVGGEALINGRRYTIIDVDGLDIVTLQPYEINTSSPYGAGLEVGDGVTLYLGCSGAIQMCADVFGNEDNFGGVPYLFTAKDQPIALTANPDT